jgi:hypothetical protein
MAVDPPGPWQDLPLVVTMHLRPARAYSSGGTASTGFGLGTLPVARLMTRPDAHGDTELWLRLGGDAGPADGTSHTLDSSSYYTIKTKIDGTSVKGKFWKDGEAEPPAWQVTLNQSATASPFFVEAAGTTATPIAYTATAEIDSIQFTGAAGTCSRDTDGDTLTDCEEAGGMLVVFGAEYFSDPLRQDTDGDLVPDDIELGDRIDLSQVTVGDTSLKTLVGHDSVFLPLSNPQLENTDADPTNPEDSRLRDADEFKFGSNAFLIDTDADGLDDPSEVLQGTDPTQADTDGDGSDDLTELMADPIVSAGPLIYDDYLTPDEWTRLYRLGYGCGELEDFCPFGDDPIRPGGPPAHETLPYTIGAIVSGFGGTPFDIRDALGAALHLDVLGAGVNLIGIVPVGEAFNALRIKDRVSRATSLLPGGRLPGVIRAIHHLNLPPIVPSGFKDELIELLIGPELQRLTDAGMTVAGKHRLFETATDFKLLDRLVQGASQRGLHSNFLDKWKDGEAAVRNPDLLAPNTGLIFSPKGVGFAEVDGGRRTFRIVDGHAPGARLARESKVGYVCLAPKCDVTRTLRQIQKDRRLLARGALDRMEWHFFPSNASSSVGADQRILDALQQTTEEVLEDGSHITVGPIPYFVHLP